MSGTDKTRKIKNKGSPSSLHGSILIDLKKKKGFQYNDIVRINGCRYVLTKFSKSKPEARLLNDTINRRLNENKKVDWNELVEVKAQKKDENQVLTNAMMLPRTVHKKEILPELKLNGNQYIGRNQTRRPKKIQNIINEIRSKSPVYTIESGKLLSNNSDAVCVRSQIRSPVNQEAKLPFHDKNEITDFTKFTPNKTLKLKSKRLRAVQIIDKQRVAKKTNNSSQSSTASELSPFSCPMKPRIGCGLQSTFSKKFRNTKCTRKPTIDYFDTEIFFPRKSKRNQNQKQNLSSLLSTSEISMMRTKIMNDFTSSL
ncbi:unnamed protein product [Moneuplotes crassus]|uniref:Uncharacterized protein n=1 Tax=Euplotes crassus TaxID=5936 RepID=A0AAD1XVG1_EUPCR|nr:unnamed protein product [Moneuplotes crassus]